MNYLAFPLLVLSQVVGPPENRTAIPDYQVKLESEFAETPEMLAAARRAQFEKRYQELVEAMNAFAKKYNDSKGNVWPAKEAEAIRKALKRIEDLGPEFQIAKK
jgi:hypothetical protein